MLKIIILLFLLITFICKSKTYPISLLMSYNITSSVITVPVFDTFTTGSNNPESGVFKCDGCNEIIPLTKDETFPPCAHCGSANWRMVAVAGKAGAKYQTGTNSPESGLFLCTNCNGQIIPIAKEDNFPPCASCNTGPKWQLIIKA
jgi:hypothetical protein